MRVGPLKLKLQIACGDAYAMGPGKADLLDAIAREGSISGAGRALGMSYRRAWLLVDEMNRCFSQRLVETLSGGGREALAAYRTIEAEAAGIADHAAYSTLVAMLRDQPDPSTSD